MEIYEVDDEAIRIRAYELSIERPDATPEENWVLAEAQLMAEASAPSEADAGRLLPKVKKPRRSRS